jgi:hypothetical protein
MKKILLTFATMGSMIFGTHVFAASSKLARSCKSDLKKFGCKTTTDAEIQECLDKNEKEGKKYEGLSRECYKAHEAYEDKMEKNEKKEHEGKESDEKH